MNINDLYTDGIEATQLLTDFTDEMQDIGSMSNTIFLKWLNRVEKTIADSILCGVTIKTIQAVSSGDTLPSNLMNLTDVEKLAGNPDNDGYYPIYQRDPSNNTEGYYIDNVKIYFTRVTNGTYRIKYNEKNRVIVYSGATADQTTKTILGNDYEDLYIYGIKQYFFKRSEQFDLSKFYETEFDNELNALVIDLTSQNLGQNTVNV